jgi:imidazolonepropionase-like amidohydrolase
VRGARLIDGTGAAAIGDALIVVDDRGMITYAGPRSGPDAPPLEGLSPESVLDAGEATLLPGLIDTHVHLTFGAAESACATLPQAPLVPLVAQIRADDEATRALRAARAATAALAAGVTTLRDCGAAGRSPHALRRLVETGEFVGPRVLVSGAPVTTRAGHCWWLGGEADSVEEVLALARSQIRDGADFVKVMATGGGMTPGSNRVRAQYPVATLAALVEDAHRLDRRVSAHCHGVEGIERAVAAGVDTIEHCSWETADGNQVDEAVAARIVRAGTYVGDTVIGNHSRFAKEGTPREALPEAARRRFELAAHLRTMGARVVTSSDAMFPVTPFEDLPWAIVATALYGGLSPVEAVHASTGLAAQAIGLVGEIGTLRPGKQADILVVAGDVAADIAALARTRLVLRDGVVVSNGTGVWAPGVY